MTKNDKKCETNETCPSCLKNGGKDMIMPRKMRRMIVIASMIVLLSIIAIVIFLVYKNTDMFKSSSTLFTKYIGQNLENIEAIYDRVGISDYNTLLQQNKYTTETQVKVNHTANIGTSSENTKNSISQLKLKINGQIDNSNQYKYQDINLLNNDEKVAQIEYIQSGITHGIKFSDLFNQYLLANNENLKELFRKMGYTEEQVENIPDTIEFNNDFKSIFEFSKEETQNLKTKYISIINSNVSKDNFSKQKDQTIQVMGKNIKVNSYILTVTKEQLNNILIKMLEELKQDETILTKIDKLENILALYQFKETINLREQFVKKLDSLIMDITKNNIGKEEAKIMVYESNQTTIRTVIQHPDYEIGIDVLPSQTEDYIQISYQNTTTENEQILTYKKASEETSVVFANKKEGKTTQYSFVVNEKVEGNRCEKSIVATYENESNRVEATVDQKINMVNSFENEVVLEEGNAINLSELETEQVQAILDRVNNSVSKEIDEITTNVIEKEDLRKLEEVIGIAKEQETLESMGITETEKKRFNSKFEILQGEEVDSSAILNLINAIQENLIDLEVVSNTELKLKLDRLNKKEEVATTLSSFIENNKNRKYDVKVEYDEATGLVSDILLTMLEK